MKHITMTYAIKAPIAKVWQAFVDPELMEKWDAGPATMDLSEGGTFGLWDGDIHGVNTKIIPEQLLEQDWYGHDHPERKYKVSFSFNADGDTTTVALDHPDVPDDEATDMEQGWRDYYFEPIKKLLEE